MLFSFIEFLFVFWREVPTGAIAGAIASTFIVIVGAVSLSAIDLGSALVWAFFGSLGGMPGSIIGQILTRKTLGPPKETAGAIVGGVIVGIAALGIIVLLVSLTTTTGWFI
jgi:hypothetical protein